MPFPLAHPAAVLPLRRQCPRWFDFPALVIGSVCPDFGYIFGSWHMARFSHSFFAGAFAFCLPVGLLLLLLFYQSRNWLIKTIPASQRGSFKTGRQMPGNSFLAIVVSLLIGIWTHLLLDSLTHEEGSLVHSIPILQTSLDVGNVHFRVYELLYSLITFVGVAWIALVYLNWRERKMAAGKWIVPGYKWAAALISATVTFLLSLANHDAPSAPSLAWVIVLTVLLMILFIVVSNWALRKRRATSPHKIRMRLAKENSP